MPFPDIFQLTGRVAIVTGGAQGLGRAMAEGLLHAGAAVVLYDCDAARGDAAARELAALGPTRFVRGSVTEPDEVAAGVRSAVEAFGGVDVLINNAGLKSPPGGHRPAQEMDLAAWRTVLDVNLTGVWLCSRAVYAPMVARGGGSIVNIASIYGLAAALLPNSPYCATKAGIMGLTRELAVEWASVGIRVNAIAPGYFATASSREHGHLADAAVSARIVENTPLGRIGDPAELQGTAIYLASAASAMVTGQTIVVDGGWLAR
ncbi:MAG TPA: glucose 1-dehydrogenase [Chloroflexota bacterium]|jgi:NAD(P)-dependent dehydrogenase (short-subunit alcohol dehydrogenase family)